MLNKGYVEFKFSEIGKFGKLGDLVSTCVVIEDKDTHEVIKVYESDSSDEEKVVSDIQALVKKHDLAGLYVSHAHYSNISSFRSKEHLRDISELFCDYVSDVNYKTNIPFKFLDAMRLDELAYVLGLDVSSYTGTTASETAHLIRDVVHAKTNPVDNVKLEKVLKYKDSETTYNHLKCILKAAEDSKGAYTKDQLLDMIYNNFEFPTFAEYQMGY